MTYNFPYDDKFNLTSVVEIRPLKVYMLSEKQLAKLLSILLI